MLARLWNSPDHEEAVGCSTIGSSEAAMLGGLALKWKWRARRKAANQPADRPNLVMGINVQVCWEKFCMANMLLDDMRRHLKFFASQPGYKPTRTRGGNSHGISHKKMAASRVSPHSSDTEITPQERM